MPCPTVRVRRGFTLIEMVVTMFALAVAMALGSSLIVAVLQSQGAGSTLQDRLAARAALADAFRADVASASSLPARAAGFEANATTLAIAVPGGHVVYRFADGKLERIEKRADSEIRRPLTMVPGSTVQFVRTEGAVSIVTLRLVEPGKRGPIRTDLSATLGGDRR